MAPDVNPLFQETLKRLWDLSGTLIWSCYVDLQRGVMTPQGTWAFTIEIAQMRRIYDTGDSPWIYRDDRRRFYRVINAVDADANIHADYQYPEAPRWSLL